MMEYRLLVISNECLSLSTSNGRTLRNLLLGWPREKLAQFYLHGEEPDNEVCGSFYQCTDRQALQAFLGRKQTKSAPLNRQTTEKKKKRNALTMLLRDVIWNSRCWTKTGFWDWTDAFAPEIILLQAGDCGFMLKLAEDLAKHYHVPLVIYNSEGYYFKNYDYFRAQGIAHVCYPLFWGMFRKQFRKTMNQASYAVYLCEELKQAYTEEFPLPAEVLYTVSDLQTFAPKVDDGDFFAAYLGNLGVGRHTPLMEIGNALQKISERATLHIYGSAPNEEIRQELEKCPGVQFHGRVSYETVKAVMEQSDLLVHGESFSDFYREDLKFAFSTKIADCLASGRCFLLYAPAEMACTSYLSRYHAAYVVDDPLELEKVLKKLVEMPVVRSKYLANAEKLTRENHRLERNAVRFHAILKEVAEKK